VSIELDAAVNEPLIILLEVLPNVEFHTPVPTVPTEVTLVCAAVTNVPSTVEAATLPNEPVETAEPDTLLCTVNEPEIVVEPVISCVSSIESPNIVDPLVNSIDPEVTSV
jgi:hypothetical protein